MRHIAYLLLVANVLYLGWNLFQDQSGDEVSAALDPLPAGVHRLVTLQEQSVDSLPGGAEALDALTKAEPPSALSVSDCKALGPFASEADAGTVADRLGELEIDPVLRTVQGQVDNGYWVYMAGTDREESREIVRRLKEKGDKEYYVGRDHVVSLGTFDGIERANVRYEQLRKMGFEAVLEQRFRSRDEFWLELPASQATGGRLDGIAQAFPGLEIHTLSCR